MHLATIRCNYAPAGALDMDYYVADFRLPPPPPRILDFFQTLSALGDPLDLSDHPLLLDIFSQGPPQLRTGLGFLFSFKVSFEKHPTVHKFKILIQDKNKRLEQTLNFPENAYIFN